MIKVSSAHFKCGVQNQDSNQQNWLNFLKVELESLKMKLQEESTALPCFHLTPHLHQLGTG